MRVLTSLTPALLTSFLLTGCDALGAFNFVQAGGISPSYADVAYGAGERQTLDLYLPKENGTPAPLLVWFYGGAWDSGDKEQYAFVARRFTAMGYAVAIPNYRLVPEVRFPAFLDDAAAALARLRSLIREQPGKISTQPMVLAGHSAGAYIAVQVVAGPDYLAKVGLGPEDVAGIIGLSGPYDFYPYKVDSSRAAFGDTPARQSQPVEQELSRMPPLLLISGNADETVRPRNSIRLSEKAPQARLQLVDGLGHAGTLLALGRFITSNKAVLEPLEQFLVTVSSPAPQS
ncbi:alpha/beta hydrolase [Parahaliea maris]|uniref:Alpha/beta hydrolase n=1 Tax=Parahaliea maris TaxID=2716870 RepID=A0A5C9A6J4_9GAMM|nr:alpha/beta hydrolase [Parahaliea maris]TXS95187.1 alpha/beta hydrolase [Parahaliea maris]